MTTDQDAAVGRIAAVAALEQASRDAKNAAYALDQAVSAARRAGVSWAVVGEATGMSRQSAHERWSLQVDKASTDTYQAATARMSVQRGAVDD